jgi:hypothetical protein
VKKHSAHKSCSKDEEMASVYFGVVKLKRYKEEESKLHGADKNDIVEVS